MDFKVALVFANDNKKDKPQEALAARLLGYIDADTGASTSVLANRTRMDKPTIDAMMKDLAGRGMVKSVPTGRKHKGVAVVIWKKV
jgi:DNA-binding MarR family transcriptional regulator